jgi:hypothetical protein
MEKVIRDGKVAVIISGGCGVGWYSWDKKHKELLFHPKLVEMVESNRHSELTQIWVSKNIGINASTVGRDNLIIVWIPEGTVFTIEENNGLEKIIILDDLTITA